MEFMKGWAPVVNATLFSLYHVFSPWQYIVRIVALIPMTFTVRWKKNFYISTLVHCLFNTINTLAAVSLFFQ